MDGVMPHWLTKRAYLEPEKIAMELDSGEKISFLDLKQKSEMFAKQLQTLGVKHGTHVGILSANHPSFIIAIHALSYIGAVAVLLNVRLTREEINFQVNDSNTSLLLTDEVMEQSAKKMSLTIPVQTFSEVETLKPGDLGVRDEIHTAEAFTIIYTSGTTGFPKGVIHTYGNHWWSAIGSVLNLGVDASDKWLATLPFYHVGGLSIFMRSVIYGIPVYVVPKFSEDMVHHAIMHKKVTIASVVPVMLKRLMNRLENDIYPQTFRCMLLGGSAASFSLLKKAKESQVPVFQSYGMTETSSQIVTLSPGVALEKIGSSGKSLFPAQVQIRHQENDGIGEIHVKGPMVTNGYYNRDSENKTVFSDGWLATGDLGYIDREGFLYIVDRRKDLIISGGENIYPSEIEGALLTIPGIEEAGVIGKDDDEWGKVPVACIVKMNPSITKESILSVLKDLLASYKIPKEIIFMDRLPRNSSQKLMRGELLKHIKKM